jgi:hypothetical protein
MIAPYLVYRAANTTDIDLDHPLLHWRQLGITLEKLTILPDPRFRAATGNM